MRFFLTGIGFNVTVNNAVDRKNQFGFVLEKYIVKDGEEVEEEKPDLVSHWESQSFASASDNFPEQVGPHMQAGSSANVSPLVSEIDIFPFNIKLDEPEFTAQEDGPKFKIEFTDDFNKFEHEEGMRNLMIDLTYEDEDDDVIFVEPIPDDEPFEYLRQLSPAPELQEGERYDDTQMLLNVLMGRDTESIPIPSLFASNSPPTTDVTPLTTDDPMSNVMADQLSTSSITAETSLKESAVNVITAPELVPDLHQPSSSSKAVSDLNETLSVAFNSPNPVEMLKTLKLDVLFRKLAEVHGIEQMMEKLKQIKDGDNADTKMNKDKQSNEDPSIPQEESPHEQVTQSVSKQKGRSQSRKDPRALRDKPTNSKKVRTALLETQRNYKGPLNEASQSQKLSVPEPVFSGAMNTPNPPRIERRKSIRLMEKGEKLCTHVKDINEPNKRNSRSRARSVSEGKSKLEKCQGSPSLETVPRSVERKSAPVKRRRKTIHDISHPEPLNKAPQSVISDVTDTPDPPTTKRRSIRLMRKAEERQEKLHSKQIEDRTTRIRARSASACKSKLVKDRKDSLDRATRSDQKKPTVAKRRKSSSSKRKLTEVSAHSESDSPPARLRKDESGSTPKESFIPVVVDMPPEPTNDATNDGSSNENRNVVKAKQDNLQQNSVVERDTRTVKNKVITQDVDQIQPTPPIVCTFRQLKTVKTLVPVMVAIPMPKSITINSSPKVPSKPKVNARSLFTLSSSHMMSEYSSTCPANGLKSTMGKATLIPYDPTHILSDVLKWKVKWLRAEHMAEHLQKFNDLSKLTASFKSCEHYVK